MSGLPTSAGRPRDPEVESRIMDAAVELFGETGWSGFSIEAVARRAKVGKASIYLRWSTKEGLLVDALHAQIGMIEGVDTGSLRGDLVELARSYLALFLGERGRASLRITLEAPYLDGVAQLWTDMGRAQARAARQMLARARARGEILSARVDTVLLDALYGATIAHVITTPTELMPKVRRGVDRYAEQLADFLLAGISSSAPELRRSAV